MSQLLEHNPPPSIGLMMTNVFLHATSPYLTNGTRQGECEMGNFVSLLASSAQKETLDIPTVEFGTGPAPDVE
jgi:hypothetical protein